MSFGSFIIQALLAVDGNSKMKTCDRHAVE